MEYRRFGQTDMNVSSLGFGCWEMGGEYGQIGEPQVIDAIQRAIDVGTNCFDTAPAYGGGKSELMLGKALGSRRKDIFLVTKCGIDNPDRPKYRDGRRGPIMASIDQSLQYLQTDYVDVLLIHWPDVDTPFDETMTALDDIVKAGKARYVGLSNFTLDQIKECMKIRRVDVVQYGLHMFDRRMEKEIFPYCHKEGIGVMVYGPLAFGMLGGEFTEDTEFDKNDWRSDENMLPELFLRMFAKENFRRNMKVVEELKPIAKGLGKKVPHLALRWVLSNPAVSTPLVGTRTTEEVEDNLGALGWTLSEGDMKEIDAVFSRHGIDTSPDMWIDSD